MVGDNPERRLWQDGFADPSTHEFVKSDVPTLLLTGEFDERSPTEHSRRIAASLSRAWLYELPGESHGGAVTGSTVSAR
jgi:pimeloyl-ACP methyl ester carboxylesterase